MGLPIRVVLELEPVDESLTGRISTSEGDSHTFAGWLGLLNTLSAVLSAHDTQADQVPPDP